jgi:protein-disulfide isomerase
MSRIPVISTTLLAAVVACSGGDASARTQPGSRPAPASTLASAPARDSVTDAADRGRILGKESAPVWFVMVSDFQCPFCKAWHDSSYRAIEKEYVETGKIRMAFINFPLHANSLPASVTAMCAAVQGKFWDTHDRIFDSQNAWKNLKDPRPFLDSLAVASGASAQKLKACENENHVQPLIAADQDRFQRAGVGGTPTFYIGNATMVGAQPLMLFRHVIDSVFAASGKNK